MPQLPAVLLLTSCRAAAVAASIVAGSRRLSNMPLNILFLS
jgi:hypothetical protein